MIHCSSYGCFGTIVKMIKNEFDDTPIPDETLAALKELNDADVHKITLDALFRILKRWIKF